MKYKERLSSRKLDSLKLAIELSRDTGLINAVTSSIKNELQREPLAHEILNEHLETIIEISNRFYEYLIEEPESEDD